MDPIVDDAARAIDDLALHRLHYTYSMVDLGTFREDYRYVIRNEGSIEHKVVPLLWRWREVQANMKVLDSADSNLVYLPSEITRLVTTKYLEDLLMQATATSSQSSLSPTPNMVSRAQPLIREALSFDSSPQARDAAAREVEAVARAEPESRPLQRAATCLALLTEFYLPFALLSDPVGPGQFGFVRHGVDLYTPSSGPRTDFWEHLRIEPFGTASLLRFFLGGRLTFRVPLAIDAFILARAKSFHLRIAVPSGLRVVPTMRLDPKRVFDRTQVAKFTSYEEGNVYVYLGEKEMLDAFRQRRSEAERRQVAVKIFDSFIRGVRARLHKLELSGRTSAGWQKTIALQNQRAGRVRLEARVPLGIARGMRPLVGLLWLLAVGAIILAGVHGLEVDRFLTVMGILVVIVLTIAVSALDKRVLREFVSAHVLSAVAVTIEAYLLGRFF